MSTTTSPANSPRSSFLVSSPRTSFAPSQRSPAASRASPRFPASSSVAYSPASSPRRAFNAPPAASSPQQPKPDSVESGPVAAGLAGYVDASTQYSPDGYPPTAGCSVAIAAGKGPPPGKSASSARNKRKEARSSGDDSSPELMSGTTTLRSAAQPPAPAEPHIRSDPDHASMDTNAAAASSSSFEPQEARSTHGHSAAPKKARPESTVKLMPTKYETCNPKDLGVLISNMLMELIRINDQIPLRDGRLTRFHSRAPPGISVSDYLQRLIQHATLPPPILLSMVYYIDRLCSEYPAFTINSLTVHRFLITAATVAAKGLSDSFWTNPTYARIGGIPVSELATLELELLQRVDWKIVPKPEVLEDYYASLVDRTDGYTIEAGSSSTSVSSGSDAGRDGPSNQDQQMVNEPT